MMSHLWVYDGFLDTSERVLTLNSEGPNFAAEGKLGKFKDVIEFKSDDHGCLHRICCAMTEPGSSS